LTRLEQYATILLVRRAVASRPSRTRQLARNPRSDRPYDGAVSK